jgi:hypothetical protein
MIEDVINPKRIRDKAPYRKSMSLTEEDMMRASELERIFNTRFSSEAPFNFSKTISKALEIAIGHMLQPATQTSSGAIQQALTGTPADQRALQARQEHRQELNQHKSRVPKKFRKS